MKWIDTGPTTDLGDGQTISIPVGRRMIAVARSGEAYFAIEDVCTHDGAQLTPIAPPPHSSSGLKWRRIIMP